MKLLHSRLKILFTTALFGFSCTEEPLFVSEDRTVLVKCLVTSVYPYLETTNLKRDNKDASVIQATIQYQAITSEEIDSIRWIFPGGTPEVVNDTQANVEYTGYGEYPAQLILTI